MGFFDKVKRKLNIGGAKIKIGDIGAIKPDSEFKVTATVQGGKIEQKVNKARATLQVETRETKYQVGAGAQGQTPTTTWETFVISQDETKGFDLKAGEKKDLEFKLSASVPRNFGLPQFSFGAISDRREKLQVRVELDIEGSVDTSDTVPVRM